MTPADRPEADAVEQVESILGGQLPAGLAPAAQVDDLPETLRVTGEAPVLFGTVC